MMIYHGDAIQYIYDTPGILEKILMQREVILKDCIRLLKTKNITEIYLTGSGSSYHAAVAAKSFLQKILGIRVFVEYPNSLLEELAYIDEHAVIFSISQQGTSVTSIQILQEARRRGLTTISVTGEYDTEITKYGEANLYVECGYEDAGSTTKGYTATVWTLLLLGMELAKEQQRMKAAEYDGYGQQLRALIDNLPQVITAANKWFEQISGDLEDCKNLIILAYGNQKGTLLEGVLKFSETCRFPVRGYEVGEFMHGMYNAVDSQVSFLYLSAPGKDAAWMMKLHDYYKKQGFRQYGINIEANEPENINRCFLNQEDFSMLEYILVLQILFVRLSRAKGINLNIPKDPDFHKIMGSKVEV